VIPPTTWRLLALCAIGAAAFFLRAWQLGRQVVIDDEWHAIHKLLDSGYGGIISSFGQVDHSIPLTLFYKLAADTVGLGEGLMHGPPLMAGLATVALLTALAWKRFGPAVALVFGWLLAASPLLVEFSRYARPYAFVVLLAAIAYIAADRWWKKEGGRGALALWLGCALSATWLHPLAGPVVGAPMLFFLGSALLLPGDARRVAALRAIKAGVAFGLLAAPFVLIPIFADPAALSGKAGFGKFELRTPVTLLYLGAGSRHASVVAVFAALMVAGGLVLLRRHAREVLLVASGAVLLTLVLAFTRPLLMEEGLVFARYTLEFLPALLLAVAVGIVSLARLVHAPAAQGAIAVVVLAFLSWGTMLKAPLKVPTSYSQHTYFTFDPRASENKPNAVIEQMPLSPFWTEVAPRLVPVDGAIGIAPWRFESPLNPLPILERRSARRIIPAFVLGYCNVPRFGEAPPGRGVALRNAVRLGDARSIQRERVRVIVWQKRWLAPGQETDALERYKWFVKPLTLRYPECEAQLRRDYGPAIYEDEWLVAFPAGAAQQ
jgi:hypothetical protein